MSLTATLFEIVRDEYMQHRKSNMDKSYFKYLFPPKEILSINDEFVLKKNIINIKASIISV
jgi:hypothetical protein